MAARRLGFALAFVASATGVLRVVAAPAIAQAEIAAPAPVAPAAPALNPSPPPAPEAPPMPPPAPGLPSTMASIVTGADTVEIDGDKVDAVLARDLYAPRAYTPQWVESGTTDRIQAVLEVLGRARAEGLEPSTYHVGPIERRLGATDERQRAELELLVSDAVMKYAVHVRTGAYRPTRATKTIDLPAVDADPTRYAIEAAAVPDVRAYMESLPPRTQAYAALKEALARYRAIAAEGGWPTLPGGPKLTPGVVDPAVRTLRARLAAEGDADAQAAPAKKANVYDPALVKSVKAFQARHGLGADGVVGTRTWDALNVSAEERARQLEIALERTRWMPEDLGDRYVMINVPDQRLEVRDRSGVDLTMPVVVGKKTWETPEFTAEMSEIVFNPPWFVPPKIARDDILPKARADGSYLARQGIAIRGGVKVAAARTGVADDAAPSPADVTVVGPIRLRQAPGPKNPLGRIKFNMPNGFGVYLHDTPNKDKFRAPDRRLSHGCVRVGDARALAAAMMRDMPEWDDARRAAVLEGWQTRKVQLDAPIPVYILYRTAWVGDDGEIQFREDVYDRDADLIARWEKPRSARRPLPPTPPPAMDVAQAQAEAVPAPGDALAPKSADAVIPVPDAEAGSGDAAAP
jgi:murein L,D-transpeptidase YcbB/YkuD